MHSKTSSIVYLFYTTLEVYTNWVCDYTKFFECIKIDNYKARKILIAEFLDKVIVSVDRVKIYFNIKFNTNGAPGENRTHAFGSGGQRSIHWATGA